MKYDKYQQYEAEKMVNTLGNVNRMYQVVHKKVTTLDLGHNCVAAWNFTQHNFSTFSTT